MEKNKITPEERELLIVKRIDKINKDSGYAKELFSTHYKDAPIENIKAWKNASDKTKRKIVEFIIKNEDKAMVNAAWTTHKFNPPKALELLNQFKQQQLEEWGIRDKNGD